MLSFLSRGVFIVLFSFSFLLGINDDSQKEVTTKLIVEYNQNYKKAKKEKKYQEAIKSLEKIIKLQKNHTQDNNALATTYNNIAGVYKIIGQYKKALFFYKKDLNLTIKTVGKNSPATLISYNSMGKIYNDIGDYNNALQYYEKALTITKNLFGMEHPFITIIYENMGKTYKCMGDYSNALLSSLTTLYQFSKK